MEMKTNHISIYNPVGVRRSVFWGAKREVGSGFARGVPARHVRPRRRPAVAVEASHSAIPPAQGLFNPDNDKDNCGTAVKLACSMANLAHLQYLLGY